jgi:hypothetical protein
MDETEIFRRERLAFLHSLNWLEISLSRFAQALGRQNFQAEPWPTELGAAPFDSLHQSRPHLHDDPNGNMRNNYRERRLAALSTSSGISSANMHSRPSRLIHVEIWLLELARSGLNPVNQFLKTRVVAQGFPIFGSFDIYKINVPFFVSPRQLIQS